MGFKRFRVKPGSRVSLDKVNPSYVDSQYKADKGKKKLGQDIASLTELQDKLYAQDRYAILLIFQAMDAAGKDSTIKHVMTGINPAGCEVYSFKSPSARDLNHDFLWRTTRTLPQRGKIGIFNRSYYEEVLVVRVHPEFLANERLPSECVTKDIWPKRFEDINNLERYLGRNGYVILKFFLHISKDEQKKRFLSRIDDPAKNWKVSKSDLEERELWDEYMKVYAEMMAETSSKHAPWFIIPANHKWFARLAVAHILVQSLEKLDLRYPEVGYEQKKFLGVMKRSLLKEK